MIQRKGDVFTTEAVFIGHGVNLRGVMGRGIAKTIKQEYPATFAIYAAECKANKLEIGTSLIVDEGDVQIVNMATQVHMGPDARYDAIFDAAMDAAAQIYELATEQDRSPVLAIPRIGCGIGGLEWEKVETLLKAVEILTPGFQFEVWNL